MVGYPYLEKLPCEVCSPISFVSARLRAVSRQLENTHAHIIQHRLQMVNQEMQSNVENKIETTICRGHVEIT